MLINRLICALKSARLLPLMLAVLCTTTSYADVVTVPVGSQTGEVSQPMPSRGETMQAVRQNLGVPKQEIEGVGIPVITWWDYGDMVVYFENELVLHTVIKPSSD